MLYPQHFHNKSLVVNYYWVLIGTTTLKNALKIKIKNKKTQQQQKQTKNEQKKIMREILNFCSPNLTKPKKKSRNTMKCHNIFTIPLFLAMVSFGLIYYYLFHRNTISIILS